MITEDLRLELLSDSAIAAFTSTRIFARQPIDAPSGTYITLRISGRGRNMVREEFVMRVMVFSKNLADLATLSDRVIVFLEGKVIINNDADYYKMWFVNQIENPERLNDGNYFNMLDFVFCKTT